jgi:hypothetical protein
MPYPHVGLNLDRGRYPILELVCYNVVFVVARMMGEVDFQLRVVVDGGMWNVDDEDDG